VRPSSCRGGSRTAPTIRSGGRAEFHLGRAFSPCPDDGLYATARQESDPPAHRRRPTGASLLATAITIYHREGAASGAPTIGPVAFSGSRGVGGES